MMRLRLRTVAIAGACLIVGIAIGFAIPRAAQVASSSSSETDRLDYTARRSAGRNVFSPDIRNDEYVRREQLKVWRCLSSNVARPEKTVS